MEPEKITRQEIEKARTVCLEFIEAKARMVETLVELGGKFSSRTALDLILWPDWLNFYRAVQFMMAKDATLEKRLQEARQALSAEGPKGTLESMTVRREGPWPGSN